MRGEGVSCGVSANEYSSIGAQINFGNLTPCLAYGRIILLSRANAALHARDCGITYSPRHRRPKPYADTPTLFKGTVA
jgi:hypothetical protein